ncbi:tRNA (adenosine(37)-N6)-threonylcarbamoyltransferase complex ATPase subunit type 1 TsaE [Candidatus Falkowbacteria bacterium]|nr:tRNA (adenosine(37)-N6)-threonylcarbamoyltransferase complex ATPase subunit type 1 TsaE [Candidatus Falkowbacteria bacterium]
MKKIITKNENETKKLGERLAKGFGNGETVAFEGDLGAGKTTLIKGIAKGFGIQRNITSPTFVLMKVYDTDSHGLRTDGHGSRITRLVHVDAYRIGDGQELIDIGIGEYLDDEKTVVVIEWAEKVREILPSDTVWIKMKHGRKENERVIMIDK